MITKIAISTLFLGLSLTIAGCGDKDEDTGDTAVEEETAEDTAAAE